MRKTLTSRMLAGLYAIWLVVALAEPAALHACELHGATHHPGTAVSGAVVAHGSTHASPRPSRGGHHSSCTCVGACCAAVAAALPVARASLLPPARIRIAMRAGTPLQASYRPAQPEHAQPPAQAPPISLS